MDISVTQAARLAGRSTRQVMRWITTRKVKAHKDPHGHWLIAVDSLATVANIDNAAMEALGQEQGVTLVALLARVEHIERELETLKRQAVRRSYMPTESALGDYTPDLSGAAVRLTSPTYTPPAERPASAVIGPLITEARGRGNLPTGTIRLIDMAKLHDVPPGTLKTQAERNPALATGLATGSRDGRQERWATPDQQRAIIVYWRSHGTRHCQCGRAECSCMF